MSNASLVAWGVPRLAELLPLDEESLTQIIEYAASLSKEEGADHLKNLLGDSPAAFEFISAFSSRRSAPPPPQRSAASSPAPAPTPPSAGGASASPRNISTSSGRKGKKAKASLHSAGPVRRPENFGDVTGGYRKEDQNEDYMPVSSGRGQQDGLGSKQSGKGGGRVVGSPLRVPPVTSSQGSSGTSSRNPSPAPPRNITTTTTSTTSHRNPPSAAGPVISDLLPNVKSKAAKSSSRGGGGGGGSKSSPSGNKGGLTTTNITDLTAAIAALEVSTNPTLGTGARKCTCYASIHPLFDPAPNCLNCGKIICALEGLQPCSFCGTPLLSNEEVQSMIRELRAERGQEKMRAHNESVHQHRDGGPGLGTGASQTPAYSNNRLDAARAHRDKLLQFQAQNAKRTRVVDEAADFETPNVASTLWMTPAQRALALKKQQRIMREMEEKARPEWEKKKTIMSLDIKGGRVTRVYQSAAEAAGSSSKAADEEVAAEAQAEEHLEGDGDRGNSGGGHAFSNNPLLASGGLLRPVWKTADGQQPETARKERQPTWRRVQDDNDDNEQWILDGGVHGYT
ncbi:uncharacterized protein BP01DRAFT_356873 [Aspergillus saccharolyticus JOP 1030-1]|uniref:TRIP4/RQT4 C2HC5-type zinc finger domain-containing protein n=1 Tax=Aspergillus saccharolyticus JOP 1030-1 TaxID=1450539 RepID=A0A318ZN92_9EURO|nr:hypothetical protein BP01DRAFT_356873 [Aspergillus saccharolyticus JOP 1030-1]PYH45370.1 hypothetical protein BP01DRAFT_356873 [Aspergillus saccharolyticus JOP 1030-1]